MGQHHDARERLDAGMWAWLSRHAMCLSAVLSRVIPDLGDAWEHADNPRYARPYSVLAIRIGINYIIYGMTH